MNAPELKPCPFCGVELEHFEDGRRLTHVRHPMNGCAFLSGKDWWKVPRFTDPWNTRADLPPTDAKVKELVEAAADCRNRLITAFPEAEHFEPIKRLRAAIAAIQEAPE